MGSGASQFKSKEEALAAGISQAEIDEYLKNKEGAAAPAAAAGTSEVTKDAKKQAKADKKAAKKQAKADKKAAKKAAKQKRKAEKKAAKAARNDSSSSSASSDSSESSDDEEKQAEKAAKKERKEAKAAEKAKVKAAKDAEKAKVKAAKDAEKANIKALEAAAKDGDSDAVAKLKEAKQTYKQNKAARKATRDAEKKRKKADKAQRKADKAKADASKLKLAMAHFHAPFQVGGAPKPDSLKKCDEIAAKFAAALASHGQNEDLINLFAADGAWQDPVGGPPPYVGTEKLKARIAKLPPMESVEVKEVFYSMSPKIFLAKTEVTFKGKKPFIILDSFELDDNMNIVKLDSHFHAPSALEGAPKPAVPDALSQRFARALFTHGQNEDLINLFTADAAWHDPVGGPPPYVGTENLKDRINKLSPIESVEVKEVFCSMSPKIFLTKTQITFKNKKPLIVLNKFISSYD